MADACGTCKFFDTTSSNSPRNDLEGTMQPPAVVWGLCRAHPPTPDRRNRVQWSVVSADDWCGEYQYAAPVVPDTPVTDTPPVVIAEP